MKSRSLVLVVLSVSLLLAEVFYLGDLEYREVDEKWFRFENNVQYDEIEPYRMIVRFSDGRNAHHSDFSEIGLQNISVESSELLGGYYVLEFDSFSNPFQTASSLFESELFDYLEFDIYLIKCDIPNDPPFSNPDSYPWNLIKIQMIDAWDIETGNPGVVLAVIDSVVDYDHEDLANNIWNNDDEFIGDYNGDGCPGNCYEDDDRDGLIDEDSHGCGRDGFDINGDPCRYENDLIDDDDENGYSDDFVGWDCSFEDNDPSILHNHGTRVSGIAAAQTNNGIGISGIMGGWDNSQHCGGKIMVIRGIDLLSNGVQSITYAVENGANIINASFGFVLESSISLDIVTIAIEAYNCVFVAASGNYGSNPEYPDQPNILYPAKFENVIAVGASNFTDRRIAEGDIPGHDIPPYTWGSCFGPNLDVVAPGEHIRTTDLSGSYYDDFGRTSAAAPHVSGLAALILSVNPSLNWRIVRDIIRGSADKVGGYDYYANSEKPGHNIEMGYGRINTYRAVSFKKGEINLDVNINIQDVISVVNFALGISEPNDYEFWASDINEDGTINVMDVILTVNLALGDDSQFFADEGTIRISKLHRPADSDADYSHEMDIQMCNENDVRGVQMTVRAPRGFEIVSVENGDYAEGKQLAHRVFEDNTKVSFIQYSMAGLPFSPGAGTLVKVGLNPTCETLKTTEETEDDFLLVNLTNSGVSLIDFEVVDQDNFQKAVDELGNKETIPAEFALHEAYPTHSTRKQSSVISYQ